MNKVVVGVVLLGVVFLGAVIWKMSAPESYPRDPIKGDLMLYKDSNPVPTPKAVQIFSSLQKGDGEKSRGKPQGSKWLRFQTADKVAIGSLVAAMREGAGEVMRPPITNVVTYHIYFEPSESGLPLYYKFYHQPETNGASGLTAYSTVGNLCNAEAVERWFVTHGVFAAAERE
jgi:hypothetical protein